MSTTAVPYEPNPIKPLGNPDYVMLSQFDDEVGRWKSVRCTMQQLYDYLNGNVVISCAGASHQIQWSIGYHMNSELDEQSLTLEINGNVFNLNDYEFHNLADFINNVLSVEAPEYSNLNADQDGYFYYIRDVFSADTYRIKLYSTDGITPIFNTDIGDVGNVTYAELPNRIGFEACIVGNPM